MKKIKKEMTFAEIMKINPEIVFKLMEMGLMCGGCPMAQFETLEQGCELHGIDVEEVLVKLNKKKNKK